MSTMDVEALLNGAKRPEKRIPLCLRGDLQAEWEALHEEAGKALVASGRKLADKADPELSARIVAVEEEMAAHTLEVTLRALPRREWLELVRDHPERPGDAGDKELGVNRDTFFDALVSRSIAAPEMTGDQKAQLLEIVTDAQHGRLVSAAWDLNRKDVSVPFSPIASRTTPNSGGASRRRSG